LREEIDQAVQLGHLWGAMTSPGFIQARSRSINGITFSGWIVETC
jgi:hypothetical protein